MFIMIVEDSHATAKIIGKYIAELGGTSVNMPDGVHAVDYFERGETMPDAILMDWNMPNMSGYDCLIKLKEIKGDDLPPVIFCTTESELDRITSAMEEGASEYIMKPFDKDILLEKLEIVGLM